MKKQLALIFSLLFCSSNCVHALSWGTSAKIIFSPIYVPYYCLKKTVPPLARFCIKHPEDALFLGIISAALIMSAKEKYQRRYPEGVGSAVRNNLFTQIPARPSSSSHNHRSMASQQPKNKYYPNLTQEKIGNLLDTCTSPSDTCSICLQAFEGLLVTTTCQHKFHKDCLANWFDVERMVHTTDHPVRRCPSISRCYKKPYSCPNCRKYYCILKP